MELECYPTENRPPEIVPGRPQRAWMDRFAERHPYRCLPLTMANTTGWDILCPVGFTMTWDGGAHQECIKFQPDHPYPGFHDFVKSHFTRGVVTFHTGYLFRTPPGWSMMAMGPPNHVKDGVQPLAGVIETDWLPFPFTMNWIFTRPGTVRFEKGETFCFIMLLQDKALESFQPVIRSMNSNPELRRQYDVWAEKRTEFNNLIFKRDPEATKEAWQRFYFKGEYPEEIQAEAPSHHVNKRRLKSPKVGV
ncbi:MULTISPECIES: DUF6065 family protein [unclassified Caulobacter]|uniref:DUF6065 family protein n=1 Tax=unclassified Caulobacter TaxID=2648921 RepID=UPI00078055C3|nr:MULTISPECIES: DUF6065 family protein [unclassified Caulobacter]AZS23075.1 hypothetical protein CSW63_22025 [Caulobacter sp. FWC26]